MAHPWPQKFHHAHRDQNEPWLLCWMLSPRFRGKAVFVFFFQEEYEKSGKNVARHLPALLMFEPLPHFAEI